MAEIQENTQNSVVFSVDSVAGNENKSENVSKTNDIDSSSNEEMFEAKNDEHNFTFRNLPGLPATLGLARMHLITSETQMERTPKQVNKEYLKSDQRSNSHSSEGKVIKTEEGVPVVVKKTHHHHGEKPSNAHGFSLSHPKPKDKEQVIRSGTVQDSAREGHRSHSGKKKHKDKKKEHHHDHKKRSKHRDSEDRHTKSIVTNENDAEKSCKGQDMTPKSKENGEVNNCTNVDDVPLADENYSVVLSVMCSLTELVCAQVGDNTKLQNATRHLSFEDGLFDLNKNLNSKPLLCTENGATEENVELKSETIDPVKCANQPINSVCETLVWSKQELSEACERLAWPKQEPGEDCETIVCPKQESVKGCEPLAQQECEPSKSEAHPNLDVKIENSEIVASKHSVLPFASKTPETETTSELKKSSTSKSSDKKDVKVEKKHQSSSNKESTRNKEASKSKDAKSSQHYKLCSRCKRHLVKRHNVGVQCRRDRYQLPLKGTGSPEDAALFLRTPRLPHNVTNSEFSHLKYGYLFRKEVYSNGGASVLHLYWDEISHIAEPEITALATEFLKETFSESPKGVAKYVMGIVNINFKS